MDGCLSDLPCGQDNRGQEHVLMVTWTCQQIVALRLCDWLEHVLPLSCSCEEMER
jgi:hypothetical protein